MKGRFQYQRTGHYKSLHAAQKAMRYYRRIGYNFFKLDELHGDHYRLYAALDTENPNKIFETFTPLNYKKA